MRGVLERPGYALGCVSCLFHLASAGLTVNLLLTATGRRSTAVSGLRRVVVGVSGSPASIRAFRIAAGQADRFDVPLIAVDAWVPPGGDLAERRAPSPYLRAIWKRAALDRLQDAIGLAWGRPPADVSVQHVVARGQAGPVMLDIADAPDDPLVVGAGGAAQSRGSGGAG